MAEVQASPVDAYEFHRGSCLNNAAAYELAAEVARRECKFAVAHACTQAAIRWRWLSEPDEDLRELFNAADRLLEVERRKQQEVPRD